MWKESNFTTVSLHAKKLSNTEVMSSPGIGIIKGSNVFIIKQVIILEKHLHIQATKDICGIV